MDALVISPFFPGEKNLKEKGISRVSSEIEWNERYMGEDFTLRIRAFHIITSL